MSEQRQHPRYAIELDSIIVVGDQAVAGRTRDLSKGGFCMHAASALPVGSSCTVKIALVFSETEFSEHLSLAATIVWCTKVKDVYQIGIKFASLDPQSRGYLDMFMKFLEGGDDEVEAEPEPSSEFEGD